MAINITSAEQANALDTQNRYNTLSGLSSQMAANDPNQLRLQRKMQGLASAGAVQNTSVGAVADSFVNKPITSSMLSSNVAPINLPTPTPPSTAGAGLSGEVTAKITNDYTNLANELKTAQDRAQQQVDNTKSTLLGKIGVSSQAITDKMAEYQKPEFLAKQKAVNDAYAEVQKLDAAQRSELEALNAQGLTGAGSQAAQAGISRKYSLARANLAVVYDIARGDLQSTIENIDRTAALKQEAVQPYIDYYSKILDGDLSAFTKADQNALQLRLAEYQRKQDDISKVGEILKTAVANGVQLSSQDVSKINSFDNPNDALGYLASKGISLQDPLDRQIKQAQLAKLQIDAKKAMQGLSEAPAGTGELAQAQAKGNIDLISGLASDKYLSSAVGPNTFARTSLFNAFTGGKSNFIAGVEQLSSQLSLDSLIRAKANGATFGALSDSELKILSASASKLGTWAIKDKDGNVIGYKTSEGEFKKEMDKINNFAKLDYLIKGGSVEDVGAQQLEDGTIWVANSDGSFTQLYP